MNGSRLGPNRSDRCGPLLAALFVTLAVILGGCGSKPGVERPAEVPDAGAWFVDIALSSGLEFHHRHGATGNYYFPEIGGGGAAFLDYDGDGDLDVYFVQGGPLKPGVESADDAGDRLFRNDSNGGSVRWVDVTATAGIEARGYGVGVAVGDVDRDGAPDLYLTNFGANQLWRNRGDGTFSDRTQESGTGEPRWSSSASFVDLDRDGRQDLYVANYTNFRFSNHKTCRSKAGNRDYCGPNSYDPEPDTLYRGLGDGSFADISLEKGIVSHYGAGLGVVAGDFDGNGWQDVYVANDQMENFLWLNDGATLVQEGLLSGTALAGDGSAQASMGVVAGDFDNDGDEDLFMTHLDGQVNTLYVHEGAGRFVDRSLATGLGSPSLPATGFGAQMIDYDNDGRLDVLAVNGAVSAVEALEKAGDPFPFHQRDQLFRNEGGQFVEVSEQAGAAFEVSRVSRGCAAGDIDNDGDVDVAISDLGDRARLLANRYAETPPFVGIAWSHGGQRSLGATVSLETDATRQHRVVRASGSYASSNDTRLTFGLGEGSPLSLELDTGDRRRRWLTPPAGTYLVLPEG